MIDPRRRAELRMKAVLARRRRRSLPSFVPPPRPSRLQSVAAPPERQLPSRGLPRFEPPARPTRTRAATPVRVAASFEPPTRPPLVSRGTPPVIVRDEAPPVPVAASRDPSPRRSFGRAAGKLTVGGALAAAIAALAIYVMPAAAVPTQPAPPIQAAFFYPWFANAWDQGGVVPYTNYTPSLGLYDSQDDATIDAQLSLARRAHLDAFIASWWGQGHHTDAAFQHIIARSERADSPFPEMRWSAYHEQEGYGDPSASAILSDLQYLDANFFGHPGHLRVDGQPVVFVYAQGSDGCGMADRWAQAEALFGGGVYVVLKVFPGYAGCANQPDSWHQYAPAVASDSQTPYSGSVSPGFWKVGESPRLARDEARFESDVQNMVASEAFWQLVTTWNEWGEGSSIEPAEEFGETYIDILCRNLPGAASCDGSEPPPPTSTSLPIGTATGTATNTATRTATSTATGTATSTAAGTATASPTATSTTGPGPAGDPSTGTIAVTALEDTFVDEQRPGNAHGNRTTIEADRRPGTKRALLRFWLPDVPENVTITSATLQLFVTNRTKRLVAAYLVDGAWNEASTWSNAPDLGDKVADVTGSNIIGGWAQAGVSDAVLGQSEVAFYVTTNANDGVDYSSSEGTRPPQLVLRWQSEGGGPGPVATATEVLGGGPPTATSTATATGVPGSPATATASATRTATRTPTPGPASTPTRTATRTPTRTATPSVTPSTTPPSTPTTPPGGDPVLVGAGDISDCGNNNDEATALLLDGIAGTVFTTGDNVYESGSSSQFTNCYNPTWGRHAGRTRPVPGNHDYGTSNASGYFGYFGSVACSPAVYCAYNLGDNWRVYQLNSEIAHGAGSTQEQWLRADLAATPRSCVVALWHKPRFSSGDTHGSDSSYQALWQALYDFGADLVLVGHEHNYERFAPQSPTGSADPTTGIRQFVVGTGGRSHYGFGSAIANSQVRNGDTFGVLKLTLHASSYDWQFVPVAGASFTDTGSGACH